MLSRNTLEQAEDYIFFEFQMGELYGGQPIWVQKVSTELKELGAEVIALTAREMHEWGECSFKVIPIDIVPNRNSQKTPIIPKEALFEHHEFAARNALPIIVEHVQKSKNRNVVLKGHCIDGTLVAYSSHKLLSSMGISSGLMAVPHSFVQERLNGFKLLSGFEGKSKNYPFETRILLEEKVYSQAARSAGVLVPSPLQKQFLDALKISEQRSAIVPWGVQHHLFFPKSEYEAREEKKIVCKSLGLEEDAQIILSSGRMHDQKNHQGSIETFSRIHSLFPKAHLIILGGENTKSDNVYQETLNSLAVEKGIKSKVTVKLFVSHEEVGAYYRSSDVLIALSLYDHWNMIISEACACGTAIIASDGAGAAIGAGDAVKKVNPLSYDSAAEYLRLLLANREERAKLSQMATKFGQSLTWRRTAEGVLELARRTSPNSWRK